VSEVGRRGFLGYLIALAATPAFAQDPVAVNELESKVKLLIGRKDFEGALKLLENQKGYDKLEAECCAEYANALRDRLEAGLPVPRGSTKEAVEAFMLGQIDKVIGLYNRAFEQKSFFANPGLRANRASVLVIKKEYDTALEDYAFAVVKEPSSKYPYGGIVDTHLRRGTSDSIAKTFVDIEAAHPGTIDSESMVRGTVIGVQRWIPIAKRSGGKLQHGESTTRMFTQMSDIFRRNWMRKSETLDVVDRVGAEYFFEAIFCTYAAGATAYAAQPYENALRAFDDIVGQRHQLIDNFVDNKLGTIETWAPHQLEKIEFRNKDVLFRQLKGREKK